MPTKMLMLALNQNKLVRVPSKQSRVLKTQIVHVDHHDTTIVHNEGTKNEARGG